MTDKVVILSLFYTIEIFTLLFFNKSKVIMTIRQGVLLMVKVLQDNDLLEKETQENIRYSGFWIRFGAGFIDSVIIALSTLLFWIIFFISLFKFGNSDIIKPESEEYQPLLLVLPTLIGIIFQWLYFVLQYCSKSMATLGMKAMGIRICDERYERLSFWHATGRWFAEILSGLTLYIGYIMIAFTAKKQGLHDIVAKTYVIRDS